MLAWMDRFIGACASTLPSVLLILFGASQILVSLILAQMLLFHLDRFPAHLMTPTIIARIWFVAVLVAAFGAIVLVLGIWNMKHEFQKRRFKL